MATYDQLLLCAEDANLRNRIRVACFIAAWAIRTETPPANSAQRKAWALSVFQNPAHMAEQMIWAVLAANASATQSAIVTASDASIQTAVASAVDSFAV
jgi:hypothetical protein